MASFRSGVDMAALSAMAARPGVDPRVWICEGYVKDLGYDPQHGVFADVFLHPAGPEVCCLVSSPYAGDGFGDHCPLKVKDTVLVAIPMGDAARGPWVIGRSWNSGDRPPPEAKSALDPREPSDERVIVVEANQNCRIVVSGTGNVIVEARGLGKVKLGADEGTLALALAPLVDTAVSTLLGYINALTLPVSGATAGPLPAPLPPPASVAATKVEGV